MIVEIDVQPLGWGAAGVPTYLRNLIAQFHIHHPALNLRFVADHSVVDLAPELVARIGPAISSMKTKLAWEAIRLPLHSAASRPDILHVPYHSATWGGWGRRVMTIHDCYLWTTPSTNRAERLYRGALGIAARRAHLVLTDSKFSSRQIELLLGVDPGRIRIVPLACASDITRPREIAEIDLLRVRYGLNHPFILYAGGTAAYKGIGSLIDAYAGLHPDLRRTTDLVLLGRLDAGVAHHRLLLDAIARFPAPGRIVTPGIVPQEDLGTFYQAARVFVFPSFYEGFGLSPLEAMACGTPVLASNRASIPEVVGDAAVSIDPASPETIVTALELVLPDDARLAAMRGASLARAGLFSWRRTADLTRAAYDAVLAR